VAKNVMDSFAQASVVEANHTISDRALPISK
jgi:hypothetical protein